MLARNSMAHDPSALHPLHVRPAWLPSWLATGQGSGTFSGLWGAGASGSCVLLNSTKRHDDAPPWLSTRRACPRLQPSPCTHFCTGVWCWPGQSTPEVRRT